MKFIVILTAVIFSLGLQAGPGHGHSHGHGHGHSHAAKKAKKPLSDQGLKQVAEKQINRLIQQKKIDVSWENAEFLNLVDKKFGGVSKKMLSYKNDKGVKGKTLYIILMADGSFVAANFTGK
jgi:molecular chaperone DnaK (HSP70)